MDSFQITLPFHHSEEQLAAAVSQYLRAKTEFRILKRSIDARHHRNILVHYTITTDLRDPVNDLYEQITAQRELLIGNIEEGMKKIVVVGSGPGGIFCALWLALHGLKPILLEQGPHVQKRIRDMAMFMKKGILHPFSNICFGAGGAGTYSDGKLITRIRSPYIAFVMDAFIQRGAPEAIRYLFNPHLGSNRIRQCITSLLEHLAKLGVKVRYETEWRDFKTISNRIAAIDTTHGTLDDIDAVFLACGHSARETYRMLRNRDVAMASKPYALGVRIEHPAHCINELQYGIDYESRYEGIETAQYKFAHTWKESDRAFYSFCMCPGGYVLNSSTEDGGVVTNGMSNYGKRGRFSNAGIVVNVSLADLEREGFPGVDGGLQFQKMIEEKFCASVNVSGAHVLPVQRLVDFLSGIKSVGLLPHSCAHPVASAEMNALFPRFISEGLEQGFLAIEKKLPGFSSNASAQIFGVESRTSSPYRIVRDDQSLTSVSHANLFPIGEGAGYAGGITSAAVDGIRAAQTYVATLLDQ